MNDFKKIVVHFDKIFYLLFTIMVKYTDLYNMHIY